MADNTAQAESETVTHASKADISLTPKEAASILSFLGTESSTPYIGDVKGGLISAAQEALGDEPVPAKPVDIISQTLARKVLSVIADTDPQAISFSKQPGNPTQTSDETGAGITIAEPANRMSISVQDKAMADLVVAATAALGKMGGYDPNAGDVSSVTVQDAQNLATALELAGIPYDGDAPNVVPRSMGFVSKASLTKLQLTPEEAGTVLALYGDIIKTDDQGKAAIANPAEAWKEGNELQTDLANAALAALKGAPVSAGTMTEDLALKLARYVAAKDPSAISYDASDDTLNVSVSGKGPQAVMTSATEALGKAAVDPGVDGSPSGYLQANDAVVVAQKLKANKIPFQGSENVTVPSTMTAKAKTGPGITKAKED